MTKLLLFFLALASLASAQEPEKAPLLYPFKVTIGDQTAAVTKHDDLFAVIARPVKADAPLKIEKESPLLIINAFPCADDGTVADAQAANIIFAQNTAEVSLKDTKDRTMQPKPLAPGTYLANIVAHGKTSRVVFTVQGNDGKVKLPDISKIIKFLKGQ
ncbi:MAG: hypothetical protein ACSHYF_04225 [Verrucomicrobiaceae bacterium]